MTLLLSGGATILYARWQIMGTGPPAFTEVDNPASFATSPFVRVSWKKWGFANINDYSKDQTVAQGSNTVNVLCKLSSQLSSLPTMPIIA